MMQPPATPVRAAIYLRISQDRELDGLAIDRQREDCENLARFRRWEIVETYVDQSRSAYDRNATRPDYDQMVQDYRAGAFQAIVCYDLDRLTRIPRQLEDWIEAAEFRGLVLVTANGDADLSTDGGRMYARIKAAVAGAEMERKSARQSVAQRQRAMLGKPPKGMRPLGYAVSGEVIADEADAVRAIFKAFTRVEHPESLRSMARALSGNPDSNVAGLVPRPKHTHTVSVERAATRTAEGLAPRPIVADGPWSPSTVLGVLRNPRYARYSTYTPKLAQLDGTRRRSYRAFILRDDLGEPIRGRWEAIVYDETWWRAQEVLDDEERVTNSSGSTKRKHLGSGLYRCAVCGSKVTGAPRGYRCAKHARRAVGDDPGVTSLMRTGDPIDEFVTYVITSRLSQGDVRRPVEVAEDSPQSLGIAAAISEQRARILRAQRDYDAEFIEGKDLKRVRDAAEQRNAELEAERLTSGRSKSLAPLLGTHDPAAAFRAASLAVRREVIDLLCTVTLLPQPRGRKGFDPASVVIEWRGAPSMSSEQDGQAPDERGEQAPVDTTTSVPVDSLRPTMEHETSRRSEVSS